MRKNRRTMSSVPVVEPTDGGCARARTCASVRGMHVLCRYLYKRGAAAGSGWRRRCVWVALNRSDAV